MGTFRRVALHRMVSSHLGHSNPGVTLGFYAHVLPRSTTELAVMADEYIFGSPLNWPE